MANLHEKAQGQAGVERPENETAMVSCRARSSQKGIERVCEGKEAKILVKEKLASGGRRITYQCLTCGRPFQISF